MGSVLGWGAALGLLTVVLVERHERSALGSTGSTDDAIPLQPQPFPEWNVMGPPPPAVVTVAQRQLIQLGYSTAAPDGVVGPSTYGALQAFMSARSIPVGTPLRDALVALDAAYREYRAGLR